MSGIFGFINLDGRPASPESFQKMADEMAGWGPDGVGSLISGSAAFGHALLIVTHESRFEKMPIHDQDEGVLFTTAARLDNRDELCDLFGIPHPEWPVTLDGQLVFRAYKKWGSESCKHIFGDWSFAAWHIKEQRLFLARDHLGNTGLYYYFKPPLVVFASNVKAVLAHPQVPCELDELRLAQNLVFIISDKGQFRTYWKDVRFLPAAHFLTMRQGHLETKKYWHLENSPSIHLGSDEEYLEGFLENYRRAVRVRLNSVRPIGTQLSAGLDSSSVTALAAEALIETNQPLVAYTSVPMFPADRYSPNAITNEWPLAHQVAQLYTNIEHIPIRSEKISPLAATKQSLEIFHTPQHAVTNMFWLISIFENARQRNLGVMLTGQLGNGGISWNGGNDYIFYLFARMHWKKGFKTLISWKERNEFSWYKAVKNQILRPMILPLWPNYPFLLNPKIDSFYSFPAKNFIERMGLNVQNRIITQPPRMAPLTEQIMTTMINGTGVGPFWHSLGSSYNLETRDPTADIRLLEFCMGVPDEQYTFEGGRRMLIRRAMTGILPDSVRWNVKRGKQAADIIPRLVEQQDEMEKEMDRLGSEPEVTNYVDVAEMKKTWLALMSGSTNIASANANAILRAINTGNFLLSFSKHRN
ncbi:MAG: asparagine synthase-related protein [Smithellaceae bacterium]|nr:asparagine synthase-related protein [Smithellaceae bacterium]